MEAQSNRIHTAIVQWEVETATVTTSFGLSL